MKKFAGILALVAIVFVGTASAAVFEARVVGPAGESSLSVAPSATVNFRVEGRLTNAVDDLGLAFFTYNLGFVGGSSSFTQGMTNVLSGFTNNSGGYSGLANDGEGTLIGGQIIQTGGAQNTIGHDGSDIGGQPVPYPNGSVAAAIAQGGFTLLGEGSWQAPASGSNTIEILAGSLFANVINLGQNVANPPLATSAVNTSIVGSLLITVSSDTEPPLMISVASMATHTTGEFGIPIDITDGVRNVETRNTGISKVDVAFNEDVQPIAPANISVVPATASTIGTSMSDASHLTITFSPALANATTYRITVAALDLAGNALGSGASDDDMCIAGLAGDFDGNGTVSAADKATLVGFVGQTVDGTNAKFDIAVGGGATINPGDVGAWTGFFGTSTGACP